MFCNRFIRWIGSASALFLITAGLSGQAQAQLREYAKVQPNVDPSIPQLTFDINAEQADNVPPNIVMSADSKTGFVSYAGSGTVIAFSMDTGDIVARIATGGRPWYETLLPDRKTLLITSVWDNQVFVFNMETRSLVSKYAFQNASFGFGSIISLSANGRTGYISSTGTGEVIAFNVADGRELARAGGFQAPAQITLSPDGSVALVVDALMEQVLVLDSSSLAKKTALDPKSKSLAVDFTIFNRAVPGPDGTNALIACSSGDLIIFKAATGEILDNRSGMGGAGFSTLTPDSEYWAVMTYFDIALVPTKDPASTSSIAYVTGEPLAAANVVFSPDSRYAYYATASSNYVFQHEMDTDNIVGRIQVEGDAFENLVQPSSIAITPDGQRLAVADFISNNIALLTTDTYALGGTKFVSTPTKFTGISLVNLSSRPAHVTIHALDNYGSLIADTGVTDPVSLTLNPGQQISQIIGQMFGLDATKDYEGWIQISSDEPQITGYLSIGDHSLTRLSGVPLFRDRLTDWILPEVIQTDTISSELNYLNPRFNQGTYVEIIYGKDGSEVVAATPYTAYPTNRQTTPFDADPAISPAIDGYRRAVDVKGLYVSEFYGTDTTSVALNAIDMNAFKGVTRLVSPQFAITDQFQTVVNLINGNANSADITVTLHAPDGSVMAQPYTTTLNSRGQLKGTLWELIADPSIANSTGWLEIQSSQDQVVGTFSYTGPDGVILTSYTFAAAPLTDFIFPIVAEDSVYQTGMAILNDNADSANLDLEVWGMDGNLVAKKNITLLPRTRSALYLGDFFPEVNQSMVGNVRVHSTRPLSAISLLTGIGYNFYMAGPAVPIP